MAHFRVILDIPRGLQPLHTDTSPSNTHLAANSASNPSIIHDSRVSSNTASLERATPATQQPVPDM
ncbi:hypothetical protein BS17DRAFT_789558, partial [Gyrodon lividus]